VRGWIMQRCDAMHEPELSGREVYAGVDAGEIRPMKRSCWSGRSCPRSRYTVGRHWQHPVCFGKHPAEWENASQRSSRARSAIEEALRYESPFQTFFRTDVRRVPRRAENEKNQKIMVSIGPQIAIRKVERIRRPSILIGKWRGNWHSEPEFTAAWGR